MDDIRNKLTQFAIGVGEKFTPVLKESKFLETGVLTPEEFVVAGDHLVHHCPTWQWARASDSSKTRDYLPADKQFLITRNVPCRQRCRQMEYDPRQEKVLSTDEIGAEEGFAGDEDSGWVDTHHYHQQPQQVAMDLDQPSEKTASNEADDDDEVDLDALVDSGDLEEADPNRFVAHQEQRGAAEVEKPRTYDLHITYDKFYQVPRLWLGGYDHDRRPLTADAMNEDFSADHAKKTITIETHPHIEGPPMASVHPCRHAETMKRLCDQLTENGKELGVHQYMLVFLKFVQAVVPTIEYDYTKSIKL
ncbi:unnamed protein product, partial [Mesorhabditis spiculigera]